MRREATWSRVMLAFLASDLAAMLVMGLGLLQQPGLAMLLGAMMVTALVIVPVTFLICLPAYALARAWGWLSPGLILAGGVLAALLPPIALMQVNDKATLSMRLVSTLAYCALAGLIAALLFCRLTGLHVRDSARHDPPV